MEAKAAAGVAALDATLTDDEWTLVQALWRAGVGDGGMHRLMRLRATYRHTTAPQVDGLAADPHARQGPERGPAPAQHIEALRRALLSTQARMRTLEALAQAGPLPPAAAAKQAVLRLEATRLRDTLHHALREEVPADSD
jgi:hypothetical protein